MLGVDGQHRELFSPEPGYGVGRPKDAAQARRDLLQETVTAVVTERVVDVLEAIEVEQQHAEHLLVAARSEQRLAESVAEQAAVGQSGQRVVQSLVLERIRMRLAF